MQGSARTPDWSAWASELADVVKATAARDNELLTAEADPIHPARIYGELVPRLADDAVVIGDGGDFVSFAGKFVEPKRPGGWLDPGPYGCLGAGLGAAIAARLARPSAQVALLLGDGAAGFSLMDVDTLVRHDLPVVMVMGNNSAWGLEKGPMQMLYGYDVAADLAQQTAYDEVVKALGGAGEKVTDPTQIGPALDRAFDSRRALPRQHHHRRERGLPAQHLRDLRSWSYVASGPTSTPRPASCALRRTNRSSAAPRTSTASGCATSRGATRGARCGWRSTTATLLGCVTDCPPGSAVARDRPATTRASSGCWRCIRTRGAAAWARPWPGCARSALVTQGRPAMVLSSLREMTGAHRIYEAARLRTRARPGLVARAGRPPDRLLEGARMSDVTLTFTVTEADTAIAVGSGSLPVLGTPRLLAWCEAATCAAIEAALPEGGTSVGTRITLEHLAASPVGAGARGAPPRRRTSTGGCTASPSPRVTRTTAAWSAPARSPGSSSTPSGSSPGSGRPRCSEPPATSTSGPGVCMECAQALGRLPWFAFFFLRARRLRPVLPMMFLQRSIALLVARDRAEGHPLKSRAWGRIQPSVMRI